MIQLALRKRLWGFALASLGLSASLPAQDLAVGVKAGTLGLGVELAAPVAADLNARLALNYLRYSHDDQLTDIDYDIDLTLKTFGALLDWHPLANGFRLSGGVFYNGNGAEIKSTTSGPVDIGNQTFLVGPGDRLTGDADFRRLAPYLGFGWGRYFGDRGAFAVSADLGILFQGSAAIELRAEGALAAAPGIDAALQREEDKAENEIDDYDLYPVISIGVSYRF